MENNSQKTLDFLNSAEIIFSKFYKEKDVYELIVLLKTSLIHVPLEIVSKSFLESVKREYKDIIGPQYGLLELIISSNKTRLEGSNAK